MISLEHLKFYAAHCFKQFLFLALLLVALLGLSFGWQPWGVIHLGGIAETPDGYWNAFMPLAQFTAASSLAYLTLAMFRQAGRIESSLNAFFGASGTQRRGRLRAMAMAGPTALVTRPNLAVMVKLQELSDFRRDWAFRKGDDRKLLTAKIRQIQNLRQSPWFDTRSGRLYAHRYVVGRDFLYAGTGLTLSVWIHIMACAEAAVQLYVPELGLSWPLRMTITLALVAFGVLIPLVNVFDGRKVWDDFEAERERGEEQRDSFELDLKLKQQQYAQSLLNQVRQSQGAAQAPRQSRRKPKAAKP